MQYVHVKNLAKFHPGYKDRTLNWAKINTCIASGDPDMEMITHEIDRWRFICFVLLELQAKKPIPIDEGYLARKGFDLKKRPIYNTLQVLHNLLEIVTDETGERNGTFNQALPRVEESRVDKSVEESRVDKRESVVRNPDHQIAVDYFCQQYETSIGTKYVFQGFKDGAIVANILKSLPVDQFKLKVDQFFASKDPFITKAGYSLPIFVSQINKLHGRGDSEAEIQRLNDIRTRLRL